MDTGALERDLEDCRRKLEDLDASLAKLESCSCELVKHLGALLSQDGSSGGSHTGGAVSLPPAGQRRFCRQRSGGDAPGAAFPSSREDELDWCLEMLKLRCQDMAEELAEVVLLAEALHALARKQAMPAGAEGLAAAGVPARGPAPPAGVPAPPAAPAAAAPAPAPSPPASPAPSPSAPTPSPPATAPAPPPAAPGAEGLAALISSPQFQKVAAQLLAQLIRK